eukprot:COSAG01_NODE_2715_length_7199_cov_15.544507_8_plen_256_part_00
MYKLEKKSLMRAGAELNTWKKQTLGPGATVAIVEVVTLADGKVRGRCSEAQGWISIRPGSMRKLEQAKVLEPEPEPELKPESKTKPNARPQPQPQPGPETELHLHGVHEWGTGISARGDAGMVLAAKMPADYEGPVPNTHWVYPNLICGSSAGLMKPEELQGLVAAGVDTFVCLQRQYSEYGCDEYPQVLRKMAKTGKTSFPRELRFLHCPMPDHDVIADESLLALVIELLREMRAGHLLYIHCYGGHGRTGTGA